MEKRIEMKRKKQNLYKLKQRAKTVLKKRQDPKNLDYTKKEKMERKEKMPDPKRQK